MEIPTILFFDPTVYGHGLVRPIQWYGRQVSQIVTEPRPKTAGAAIARVVAVLALALLSPSLIVTAPSALLGLAIKYYFQSPSRPATPETPRSETPAASRPATPVVPSPPPSVPCTPEVVEAATKRAAELITMYNNLKGFRESNAHNLLDGIAQFSSLYEMHRNPDPSNIDEMTKIFGRIDTMTAAIATVQAAQERWVDFYQQRADEQGVLPQPKDGNCWLHVAIIGLQHIGVSGFSDTHETLRSRVVDWMEANHRSDETLSRFIDDAIEAHKAVETRRLQTDIDSIQGMITGRLIPKSQGESPIRKNRGEIRALENFSRDDYFVHMKRAGSHGTRAELYAISRLFQVNVAIWREIPPHRDQLSRLTKGFDEQIDYPDTTHTINFVLAQEGNHFNYGLPSLVDARGA